MAGRAREKAKRTDCRRLAQSGDAHSSQPGEEGNLEGTATASGARVREQGLLCLPSPAFSLRLSFPSSLLSADVKFLACCSLGQASRNDQVGKAPGGREGLAC